MKNIKYFTLAILALIALSSCSKHKIYFDSENVTANSAEFQLFNDLAERSGEGAAVSRLECVVLGERDTLATSTYPLNTRNVIPSGSTTRFFVREPGTYTIKAWKLHSDAKAGAEPNYTGTFTITARKQTVHIFNWNMDPIVLDGDYPYIRSDRPNSTEYIYFNFINVFQEGTYSADHSQMSPSTKRLQYQMRLNNASWDGMPTGRTEWQNIGEPVGFGEQTGFCPVVVPNNGQGFTGGIAVDKIGYWAVTVYTRVLDADTGEQFIGEDYWSGIRLGRFLHHVAYTKNKPANGVLCYQFYAL